MSQHKENKNCTCTTRCKDCKCNPSTSSSKEMVHPHPARYFGQYPGDMEDFIIGIIDRRPKYTTLEEAIKDVNNE